MSIISRILGFFRKPVPPADSREAQIRAAVAQYKAAEAELEAIGLGVLDRGGRENAIARTVEAYELIRELERDPL